DQSRLTYRQCLADASAMSAVTQDRLRAVVAANPDVIVCWLLLADGSYLSATRPEPREHVAIPASSVVGRLGRPLPATTLVLTGTTEDMIRGRQSVPDQLAIWKLADGHVMLTRPVPDAVGREQVAAVGVVLTAREQVDAEQVNFVLR